MPEASIELRLDSGVAVGGGAPLQLALEVRAPDPAALGAVPVVLACLPGGAVNRYFYDLVPEGKAAADLSFSFARQMAGRGFIVVTIDHPGIGGSDRPEDGYALTPELVVQADHQALQQVLARLRGGGLLPGLPPLPELAAIGVGHSMGALLTVLQQHRYRPYAGLALLGFGTRGVPEYLSPEVIALAADTQVVRAQLPQLARSMFEAPRSEARSSRQSVDLFAGANADLRGVSALRRARDRMLPLPAYLSMLPGNVAPEAAQIDAPLFLAVGERDIAGPPHQIPAAFPASRDLSLHILPESGHSHFLFPARTGLFDRLAGWARLVAAGVMTE